MVCKEELCSWFKNLSPHKRIDFMCGMLQMCLPMELRFIGSYVEDLAKKDFHHLREAEGKANSRAELSKLNELNDKIFRTKMAIYLGLIHSSNRTCSSIIYTLLEENMDRAFTVIKNMDNITIHNILLVLSMAINHPAFSYNQKERMYEYYKKACDAAFGLYDEQEPDFFPTLILAEDCDTRSCDQHLPPTCSQQDVSSSPTPSAIVHVCNIELKGSRLKDRDKQTLEYRLQVTWSNGEQRDVYKTYQDLADFHNKLVQLFPEETNELKQQINVFNNQGVPNHKDQNREQLSLYSRYISGLPQHVLECGFIISFFGAISAAAVQTSDACTSPRSQSVTDTPTVNCMPNSGDEEASVIHYYPSKALPTALLAQSPTPGDSGSRSPHSPAHHNIAYSGSLQSPSYSTKTTSPLISSPCPSPASSRTDSPLNSRSSSPGSQTATFTGVVTLLNQLQLGKYADILSKHSLEQLSSMRNEDMESLGLPAECVVKIKAVLEKPRERACHIPNGLLGPTQPMIWHPPPPVHAPYLPPYPSAPLAFPHQGPPIFPFGHILGYTYPPMASSGIRDMSPTNSECSSPSPNQLPLAPATQTDSSSDDNEKARQTNHRWNGQLPLPSRSSHPNNGPSDGKPGVAMKVNTPPPNLDSANETNAQNSSYTSSGYTSDPTYNAHQPPLIQPTLSAHPAHTNFVRHPTHINSMPDNYTRPGGPYGPVVIPVPASIAMATTVTGSHGYSMPSDIGHRTVVYLPGDQSIMHRSHLYNNNNGNHPPFANGSVPPGGAGYSSHHPPPNPTGSKAYPGPAGAVPRVTAVIGPPQTNGIDAGTDAGKAHSVEPGAQGLGLLPIPTPSSSAVTLTTSGHSMQTNGITSQPSCTSCGCPGHSSNNAVPYGFPHMAPNFWPPYANGLIPVPMQHMYIQPSPLPNGRGPELLYNHPYGLHHSTGHRVAATVPHHLLHGYNPCNSHQTVPHSKAKKMNCHNCGSSEHIAADCMEGSMDALSGHLHYSYKPKNDSD